MPGLVLQIRMSGKLCVTLRSSMEGCLKLRDEGGGGCILGHSMKKGSNHGREPSGGLNCAWLYKPKATIKQSLSKVTLTVELQTTGKAHDRKNQKEGKNKQDHRDITLNKSLGCVMTCAGTLKANFSKTFKTLLKINHSCTLEVKWCKHHTGHVCLWGCQWEILDVISLINATGIPQWSFRSRLGFVSQQQSRTWRAYDRIIWHSRCNPVVMKVYF